MQPTARRNGGTVDEVVDESFLGGMPPTEDGNMSWPGLKS